VGGGSNTARRIVCPQFSVCCDSPEIISTVPVVGVNKDLCTVEEDKA
jgi:hypothetical protein